MDEKQFPYVPGAVVVAKAKIYERKEHYAWGQPPGVVSSEKLYFSFSSEREGPNSKWAEATPQATLEMTISQQGALGAMKLGKDYLIAFIPCEPDA